MGRLLGSATCLPCEDGGIPLSALPKDTTRKLAGLLSTLFLAVLSAKQGNCKYYFLKSFGMTRLGKMNPGSTDCKVNSVTTTPSCRCQRNACPTFTTELYPILLHSGTKARRCSQVTWHHKYRYDGG